MTYVGAIEVYRAWKQIRLQPYLLKVIPMLTDSPKYDMVLEKVVETLTRSQ